ncbi:Nuclear speckle splicing regulatory protein 1 [Triplophysa tibetana]|uniref:Nuclear speckle splicing regulatory protein 1 n=1 Tax=Triplophysa tibetana TaxID=1572043 RepID=A0A5A9PHW8_9TELE|nr:Nuclear speckle splicing regulatory protein 1 [Triplophysa tibetana]
MATSGKQYGLVLPQKNASKSVPLPRPSVFGDDSDDETTVGQSLLKEALKKKMMKQTRLEMQKALEEDSTVYEYDSVYDDLQKQKVESNKKMLGGTDRKPKYINQLLVAVEERKKEQERRDERKIQKEREAEGEQFADKEAFVTSAYRQKLKERQEELEKEKREAELEAALDVKKQKDLSGFYRHLLNQTVGEEAVPDRSAKKEEKATGSAATEKSPTPELPPKQSESRAESHSDEDQGDNRTEFTKATNSNHSKRHYRQKSPSDSEDEQERDRKEARERSHKERDKGKDKERERVRERDREDRYSYRKEDKDRRRDREQDREDNRGRDRDDRRGKKDRDIEDRHGRRDAKRDRRDNSPKDREQKGEQMPETHMDGERHKLDSKGKNTDEEKMERKSDSDKEKEKAKESEDGQQEVGKFAKRSSEQTVSSARERYIARQLSRSAARPHVEKEED